MALVHESNSKTTAVLMKDNKKAPLKAPKKLYIPVRILTNAINKDDIAINATYISIEDLTSEGSKQTQKKGRDVEIRYLEKIRGIRNKIKSSYSCNQEQCPFIKERLDQHQLEHHTSNPLTHLCSHTKQSQTVLISPKPSILKRTSNTRYTENHSMQTLPKCMDFNNTVQDNINNDVLKSNNHTSYDCMMCGHSFQNANKINTNEKKITFTARNCAMKDDLQDAVTKWFEDIQIYPDLTLSVKNIRRNIIDEFVETIYILTNDENTRTNYEEKLRVEIDIFLNFILLRYPGAKSDPDSFIESIKTSLFSKINDLRSTVHFYKNIPIDNGANTDASLVAFPSKNPLNENIAKLIESEILDWLMQIEFKESEDVGRTFDIIETTNIFVQRLKHVLNRPNNTRNYKSVLKYLIIVTLNDLPYVLQYRRNKRAYLNRIAEELTNRLLYIQLKHRNSYSCYQFPSDRNMSHISVYSNSDLSTSAQEGLDSYLGGFQIHSRFGIIEDVTDIVIDCIESIYSNDVFKKSEAGNALSKSTKTTKTQASIPVTDAEAENVKDILTKDIMHHAKYSNQTADGLSICNTVSVFTSEHELATSSTYPVTSTPKQKLYTKDIVKQNPEESDYANKVSNLIRAWMNTLPKTFNDDNNFKETAVMDLAGDIVDQAKLEQLAPKSILDRNNIISYTIIRWLYRFNVFEELPEEIPQVGELVKRCNKLTIPNLSRPLQGNRQVISKAKDKESELDFFVSKGTDVFEDVISIWINEHSTNFFSKRDKASHSTMVHELAQRLRNKQSDKDIGIEISKWLKKVLKSSERKNIDALSESLKDSIVKVPQDQTLKDYLQKKIQGKLEDKAICLDLNQEEITDETHIIPIKSDTDLTLMEFINKFMEHYYEVDDSIARYAFGELLKREFHKLNPPTRKEIYENFTKTKKYEDFSAERFERELEYIKIVSDWLRNIPIQRAFNTPHNVERIEFVNNLAKNICEVEEERRNSPTAMDYNIYLASIVSQFTNQLPVLPEHKGNEMLMIDELIGKIIANRASMSCCQNYDDTTTSSQNSTRIEQHNISDFVDNYIHRYAGDFTDDEMKMDAWSRRVLVEVKKVVQNTAEPSTLYKAQVYNKLMNVSIPGEESIRLFAKELDYAREISDWMKNLPLLQSPEANELRVKLICELAETFSDREKNQLVNKSEAKTDAQMEEYITQWIQNIPLNSRKEIRIPVLVQQLLKRSERVRKSKEADDNPRKTMKKRSSHTSKKSNTKSSKSRSKSSKCPTFSNSSKIGQVVVETIKTWSNKLPVQTNNKDDEKRMKEEITIKLYQKVGELSVDPQAKNDNRLFQELLTDEINAQLSNLSKNVDLERKKEVLKNELVEKVMEAKNIAQEYAARDDYRQELENTIEASIPNPISNKQLYDPGFEIYKNRLADMFILENFDHGNDSVKMSYERRIRNEIDRYFQNAQKRNFIPLNSSEMYNELYSALFKVPIPNEAPTMEEVEEVKTRCEIGMWFETLPIREPFSLTELLEWDKILSMIAKRLCEIEQTKTYPDEKTLMEVAKWVVKFPLLPGEESNADKFANQLLDRLKSSREDRKCVTINFKDKEPKKSKACEKFTKTKKPVVNTSQLLGPSNKGQTWESPSPLQSPNCCQSYPAPQKKPAELILEVVEAWCEQLPFPVITAQDRDNNKIIRDNLLTKIIMKICELNSTAKTFNNEILYDYFLDAELENLMTNLPICCDLEKTKNAKKIQLKEAIKSVMPLMKEERAHHEYKQELKNIIDKVLKQPLNSTMERLAIVNQLKEDIVDNFILYNYMIVDDDEGKQVYKAKLYNVVLKFFQDIKDSSENHLVNPLIRQNQLLCEMAKVPIPSDRMLKNEVEEIKMKNEVQEFFNELALPKETEDDMTFGNNLKVSIAKQLYEMKNMGHNCINDAKMKKDMNRFLQKLNVEVSPDKVDNFVNKLKMNEVSRKAPSIRNSITGPSTTNNVESKVHLADMRTNSAIKQSCSMHKCGIGKDRSLGTTLYEYKRFGDDIPATSSPAQEAQARELNFQQSFSNQRFASEPTPISKYAVGKQIRVNDSANIRNRRRKSPTSDDDNAQQICQCGRKLIKLRGRPRCILRMEDCDPLEQFSPLWIPMPYGVPLGHFYF